METAAENIYETHTNIKQNYEYNLGVSEKYRFEVLENYFKEKGIVRHQLDTFNDYIKRQQFPNSFFCHNYFSGFANM